MKKYTLFICLVYLLASCNSQSRNDQQKIALNEIEVSNFDTYRHIYNDFNDQIHGWVKDSLCAAEFLFLNNWQLDSLLRFDSDSIYCVGFVSNQSRLQLAVFDYLQEVNGFKIDGKWRVYKIGNSLVVPRAGYKEGERAVKVLPMNTLGMLSQVGRREVLQSIDSLVFEERKREWVKYSNCNFDSIECMKAYFDSIDVKASECKIDFLELERQIKSWEEFMERKEN